MARPAMAERAATRGGDAGRGLGGALPGGGGQEASEAAAKAAVEAAAMAAAKAAVEAAAMASANAAAAAVEASTTEASADTAATEKFIAALSSTAPTADAAPRHLPRSLPPQVLTRCSRQRRCSRETQSSRVTGAPPRGHTIAWG